MKRFSAFFQFMLGFFLGIAILVGGTTALAYVVFSRLSSPPPKPTFAEEQPKPEATTPPKEAAKREPSPVAAKTEPSEASEPKTDTPKVKPSNAETTETTANTPDAKPSEPETSENLPDGAYKARVTWSDGLSLRSEASTQSERIGGVAYNRELTVIDTSADGQWHKIRLNSGEEGWVKAGNLEKTQ